MKRALTAKVHVGTFFRTILPAVIIVVLGAAVIFGVLVYKLSYPDAVPETVDPSHYLLPSLDVSIPTNDNKELSGWWIPGLKGAPGIILAPGYGMSRSDGLSLASALHENGFNLLIYDQRGNGASPKGASSLGLYEPADMLQAVKFVQSRPESDRSRLGIWGVDVGAHSALRAAADCSEVRAIVADGAFESVTEFLGYRVSEDFGLDNRLVHFGCFQIFQLSHLFGRSYLSGRISLQALSDRTILFIKGENRMGLGDLTTAIYDKIQPQKEMISFKTARVHAMSGEDLGSYDRQVSNFFHLNLQ